MRENNTVQEDDEDGQQQEQYASPKRRPQHLIDLPPLPGLGKRR